MKSLSLSESSSITDASVISISKHCSRLKHLSLIGCNKITVVSLIYIANPCLLLQKVFVTDCDQLPQHLRKCFCLLVELKADLLVY